MYMESPRAPYLATAVKLGRDLIKGKVSLEQVTEFHTPAPDKVLELSALSAIFGDDQQAKLFILDKFIDQTNKISKQLGAHCHVENPERISFHAHKLKSSARTVGANNLSDLCLDLEVAGRRDEPDWDHTHQLVEQVRPCLEQLKARLKEL
jgi:HPt (histidine-containing phosphotransfer) domain-containing protein